MRSIAAAIGLMFPNFQVFNLADDFAAGATAPWSRVALTAAYALGYIAATCALAVFSFRKREI
jgi:hypothetical protein